MTTADHEYCTFEPDGTITYHTKPDGSPLSDADREICAEWNRQRVGYRAVDYVMDDTKGLCKSTHDINRAWRYLCLRGSTQVGWLIIGLVAYIIWA